MEKIETQLKNLTPELSMRESQALWSRIEGGLSPRTAKAPQKKKRHFLRALTAGTVIVGLLGGSVVTAYASEALPGDALYPAKLTIERAQIVLAPAAKKKELELAFVDRRVREVGVVLADIEEETDEVAEIPNATLAIVAPESSAMGTMMVEVPLGETAPDAQMMMAMEDVPVGEGTGNTSRMMNRSKEIGRAEQTATSGIEATPTPESLEMGEAEDLSLDRKAPAHRTKRWKNLEKKKKALTVAIRELERSREALKENGATSTSERVEEVIVNLTELNTTGMTPDEMFVERIRNSEVRVLPSEESEDEEGTEGDSSEDTREKDADEDRKKDAASLTEDAQIASVVVALEPEVMRETEQEIAEVKVRNTERRNKLKSDSRRKETGRRWEDVREERRVQICLSNDGIFRELSVLEKDLSRFDDKEFVRGHCPVPAASSTVPSSVPKGGERDILDE